MQLFKSTRTMTVIVVLGVAVLANYIHDVLTRFSAYNRLHQTQPWYCAEALDKVVIMLLCSGALWFLHRGGIGNILREMRLDNVSSRGVIIMSVCTLPMLIGFALTRRLDPNLNLAEIAFRDFFSPMVEEIHVRGFAFLQLYRRARWPFWLAAMPQALLAAFSHIEQGDTFRDRCEIFFLIFSGALIFSWLLKKWDSLWVPFVLHALMNLWWDLFSVSRNILGGWFPFTLQQLTMILVLGVTLYHFAGRNGSRSDQTATLGSGLI